MIHDQTTYRKMRIMRVDQAEVELFDRNAPD